MSKRFIALTCEALARSIYALAAETPHTVSIRLFKQGLHNQPRGLREVLQEQIDAIEPGECDAILLAYGLCGTATAGLTAHHTPLVIPRAHDCITLYLGSRERYDEEFKKHPGTYWYSVDYMERQDGTSQVALGAAGIEASEAEYEKYVQKFGKETADMLIVELRKWAAHYSRAAFIDTGLGDPEPFIQMAQNKAQQEGWVFERLQGNKRMLKLLINGEWDNADMLVVPPGYRIKQSYGEDVVEAVNPAD